MKKILPLLAVLFHLYAFSLHAYDFGLVFGQNADINVPSSNNSDISGALLPRFTMPLREKDSLYVSAAINYKTGPFVIIPELTRADVNFNLGNTDLLGSINLNAGRMFYSDPLGITADGLFDGAQVTFITPNGNIRAGNWYTGLLYRERAAITMTLDELKSSNKKVADDGFADAYFAPSRIFAALEYDPPTIAELFGLRTSIITQFDAGNENLHSQYLTAVLSFPWKSYIFDLGGCFELIEYNNEITPALEADIGLTYILPTELEKHLKLLWRFSSGTGKTIGAFLPITTVPQGEIVEAKLSGLSLLSLDFMGRLAKSLSANAALTYFIRNDLETYKYYPITGEASNGYFLGAELFGRLIWTISSEIRLNFGTGVFMPSLGNASPNAGVLWRTKLNLVLSIY